MQGDLVDPPVVDIGQERAVDEGNTKPAAAEECQLHTDHAPLLSFCAGKGQDGVATVVGQAGRKGPTMNLSRRAVAATGITAVLALAACAPGTQPSAPQQTPAASTSVNTDPASMGDVTLTVWDQEVRGGQDAQLKALNAAFMQKYPNIKIERNSRSFDDLVKTLRLALSGDDAPDVVQANNTRAQMGEFVKAGQLISLDPWMQAYGWDKRYPESVRSVVSYSPDGKTFGQGSVYGMPQVGEVVGVFANTKKMNELGISQPKTWAEFEAALAKAKSGGETPLVLGNLDKWPAAHVFGVIQGQYVQPDQIRALGFGNAGASWNTPRTPRRRPNSSSGSTPGTSPRASTAPGTTPRGSRSPRVRASSSSRARGCRRTCRPRWARTSVSSSRRPRRRAAPCTPRAPRVSPSPSRTRPTTPTRQRRTSTSSPTPTP
ncbi:hypothetical protein GCM10025883_02270 [Mobilicoccus caccae]|uniref:Extracellular solute-binding protein n=1 Tax=Mobilicoccus caccae TaxID=1859295 RepID=A0ABQ6IN65_9MICO|nr:hypothetical protein GCM10025883_02270 [Mobilicoccus caccae]